ncbi:MAG: D-alanine--D-alanine ligase, partial [Candidatus Omnitrophica bacterium]|nr:D-alanine--D-alanine ligase [Candidatus Omnitrophota bacterium]
MNVKQKRVGVLMGGPSSERDISIKSGKAVFHALKKNNINAVSYELAMPLNTNGYVQSVKEKIGAMDIDIAFIALHGEFGEGGTIQKILEEIKIPYAGSKTRASKLAIDKIASREIFEKNNIPVPRYNVVVRGEVLPDEPVSDDIKIFFEELSMPIVVKPSTEGSSIGLSMVDSENNLYKAVSNAFKYSDRVIIEEYIEGREITVGILEDRALPVVEIIPKNRFFDFEAKYNKGATDYKVPAGIDKEKYRECQEMALLAHK